MRRIPVSLAVAVTATVALCCGGGGLVVAAGTMTGGSPNKPRTQNASTQCGTAANIPTVKRDTPKVAGFNARQIENAATIVKVGQDLEVPPRGWIIAVATAMQESSLDNLGHLGEDNDHDSLGLFQQRPSQGWGTPEQVRDPVYASKKFYQALLKVPDWQTMPLTRAAQTVQRSAYPDAYAKHEPKATEIVDKITGGASKTAVTAQVAGRCAKPDEVTSGGWVRPVDAPVGSGYRTAERPDHQGVDLSTRRGVPVRAAAAGTVIHMECDKAEIGYNCDRDGSPSTPGCGWYLDIRHSGNWVTRYCHLLRKPLVGTGDKVTAGQQIGLLGTSGHSSGPHLHFEVHKNGGRTKATAINPVKFMADRGAPLGEGKRA